MPADAPERPTVTPRAAARPSGGGLGAAFPAHLDAAAHAGLVTLLAGWLVLALCLAPYLANQTNFPGHEHPDGTPAHTHTLQMVFGPALLGAASVVLVLALRPGGFLPPRPAGWLEPAPPTSAHGSRAPPHPL